MSCQILEQYSNMQEVVIIQLDHGRAIKGLIIAISASLIFWAGIKYAQLRLETKEPIIVTTHDSLKIDEKEKEVKQELEFVTVHVVGAVEKSGIYTLGKGKRVADVLDLAKPTEEALLDMINLAEVLEDQRQINIPKKGQEIILSMNNPPNLAQGSTKTGQKQLININSATIEELDSLPGIGKTYAERIITYRINHGSFKSIEEIQAVKGIGPATFEKIKNLIRV